MEIITDKQELDALNAFIEKDDYRDFFCHPSNFTYKQKCLYDLTVLFKDTKVIFSSTSDKKRQASFVCTRENKNIGFIRGTGPEKNWDGVAEALFFQEMGHNPLVLASCKSLLKTKKLGNPFGNPKKTVITKRELNF